MYFDRNAKVWIDPEQHVETAVYAKLTYREKADSPVFTFSCRCNRITPEKNGAMVRVWLRSNPFTKTQITIPILTQTTICVTAYLGDRRIFADNFYVADSSRYLLRRATFTLDFSDIAERDVAVELYIHSSDENSSVYIVNDGKPQTGTLSGTHLLKGYTPYLRMALVGVTLGGLCMAIFVAYVHWERAGIFRVAFQPAIAVVVAILGVSIGRQWIVAVGSRFIRYVVRISRKERVLVVACLAIVFAFLVKESATVGHSMYVRMAYESQVKGILGEPTGNLTRAAPAIAELVATQPYRMENAIIVDWCVYGYAQDSTDATRYQDAVKTVIAEPVFRAAMDNLAEMSAGGGAKETIDSTRSFDPLLWYALLAAKSNDSKVLNHARELLDKRVDTRAKLLQVSLDINSMLTRIGTRFRAHKRQALDGIDFGSEPLAGHVRSLEALCDRSAVTLYGTVEYQYACDRLGEAYVIYYMFLKDDDASKATTQLQRGLHWWSELMQARTKETVNGGRRWGPSPEFFVLYKYCAVQDELTKEAAALQAYLQALDILGPEFTEEFSAKILKRHPMRSQVADWRRNTISEATTGDRDLYDLVRVKIQENARYDW